MIDFQYRRATSTDEALRFAAAGGANPDSASRLRAARYLGGGTNLLDLMREGVEQPEMLVDVSRLPLGSIDELEGGGLRIGATLRNSRLAADARVRERYPVLSEAILLGASAQLRNMATTAGNLMQRTRCTYFYDTSARCNKRRPGSGCDALGGFNRIHAVLGTSAECIASHPSDMCVALAALDATIRIEGTGGAREVPINDFHRLPGDTPERDTNLNAGELITAVDLPPALNGGNWRYRKVRDRASYAFALVSVAGFLQLEDGVVKNVRIAVGGVAHKPWRAILAERSLHGQVFSEAAARHAAELELAVATGYSHNTFKIELAKRTITSVLTEIAGANP